jgi:hypothetical protein
MNIDKFECTKCNKFFGKNNFPRHIMSCPGKKICPVCYKEFVSNSVTCSYGCSNTYFRSGEDNANWRQDSYRSTCFKYHEKVCIICGEQNIVSVHHLNENHDDNSPENLIPMCPTHHQYMHSRYKNEILTRVEEYVKLWKIQG